MADGKPVDGAAVTLYLENANLQDVWARGGPNKAVSDAAYPLATTDGHGIGRFENLLPGRYRVLAATAGPSGSELAAAAIDIPVQVGQTTNFRLKIFPQANSASFTVIQEDNRPHVGMGADQFGPVDQIQASSSASLDSSGLGQISLPHVGLWRLDFMFRNSPITFFPIHPPYFQASGKVDENLPTEYASILRGAGFEADTVSDEKLDHLHDTML